jgi:hypothetical protein
VGFSALYPRMGRPSIPREKLLRARVLQAFYPLGAAVDGAAGV